MRLIRCDQMSLSRTLKYSYPLFHISKLIGPHSWFAFVIHQDKVGCQRKKEEDKVGFQSGSEIIITCNFVNTPRHKVKLYRCRIIKNFFIFIPPSFHHCHKAYKVTNKTL